MNVYQHTMALCPVCKSKVTARIAGFDDGVFLEKFCREHGYSKALISSDVAWYNESQRYVKPKELPEAVYDQTFKGCPESCGSCREHQQHTCLPVIEINSVCNMNCPVCLKEDHHCSSMTVSDFEEILNSLFKYESRIDVLNLSGGEPTMHPDLETFLHLCKDKGVMQTTVSTNGKLFLKNDRLVEIFKETGTIAALQFDGFRPNTYSVLRGEDLSSEKLDIIKLFDREGIRYSLVSTVAKNINDDEIPQIADFFFRSGAVSLMLQPVSLTGHARSFEVQNKITVPDVVHKLEQSDFIKSGDFNPLPCSHFSCFALSYYFTIDEHKFIPLKEFLGSEGYLNLIANKTLPGLDSDGFNLIRDKLYDVWSLADSGSLSDQALKRIRNVLTEIAKGADPKKAFELGASSMKAVFIHDFMDVHTFDFGRVIKCCNPYPVAGGKLIPMCNQNMFFSVKQDA